MIFYRRYFKEFLKNHPLTLLHRRRNKDEALKGILLKTLFTNIKPFTYALLAVIMLVQAGVCHAQEISAKAASPKYDYVIGDRINIDLEVTHPGNFTVSWKQNNPATGTLELADSISRDSAEENNIIHLRIHQPYAGFDSGILIYPAQEFVFKKQGENNTFSVKTEPLKFRITSISVDPKKDIKPIVDVVDPGIDFMLYLKWLGVVIICGIVLGALYLLIMRRLRRKEPEALPAPSAQRKAWETAMEQLYELKNKDLPAQGRLKEYYTAISMITRRFISAYHRVNAMEETMDELQEQLHGRGVSRGDIFNITGILGMADSVKFAKYRPEDEVHTQVLQQAIDLVEKARKEHDAGNGDAGDAKSLVP